MYIYMYIWSLACINDLYQVICENCSLRLLTIPFFTFSFPVLVTFFLSLLPESYTGNTLLLFYYWISYTSDVAFSHWDTFKDCSNALNHHCHHSLIITFQVFTNLDCPQQDYVMPFFPIIVVVSALKDFVVQKH